MTLHEYLTGDETGSVSALARKLGCSRQMVYNYAAGTNTPGLKLAARIQHATRGQVKILDWPVVEKELETKKTLDKIEDLW